MKFIIDAKNNRVSINLKKKGISVSINTDTVYSFDREGRLIGAFMDGRNFRRGLDNHVLMKWRSHENGRLQKFRQMQTADEKRTFFHRIFSNLEEIKSAVISGSYEEVKVIQKTLEDILSKNISYLENEAYKFRQIYKPISILPSDQYYSIVLQVSEGCSYNRCSFCGFYKNRPFKIKSPEEFEEHVDAVKAFLGEGILYRRSIFIADGDALMIPQVRLEKIFSIIRQEFSDYPVYSFMDAFRGNIKSESDYRKMVGWGVKRIYIGLETGNPELLEFIEKPGTPEIMRDEVLKIKSAGANAGVIVMTGVGGDKFYSQHVKDTIRVINDMQLRKGDFLYFSEFVEHENQPYIKKARIANIRPLTGTLIQQQRNNILAGLKFKTSKPKISSYDIREFIY